MVKDKNSDPYVGAEEDVIAASVGVLAKIELDGACEATAPEAKNLRAAIDRLDSLMLGRADALGAARLMATAMAEGGPVNQGDREAQTLRAALENEGRVEAQKTETADAPA